MRFLALVNPVSGGQAGGRFLQRLRNLFSGQYPGSEVLEIDQAKLKSQLQKAQGFDCFVVAGGDGSVSQIVQCADSSTPKIAIYPLGTGNDLARELGVYGPAKQLGLEEWLGWCESAAVRELDVWRFCREPDVEDGIRFCNYLSIGFDAAVVGCFHRWRYRFPGLVRLGGQWANRLGYALAGFGCLTNQKIESLELGVGGNEFAQVRNLRALFFTSIKSCMGLGRLNARSDPFDQQIEAVSVHSVLNYGAMVAPWLPFPAAELSGSAGSWTLRISRALALQADGEPRGKIEPGDFRVERCGSVLVLVGTGSATA